MSWSTEMELTFLEQMGKFSQVKTPRLTLLSSYLVAMQMRHDFGGMDRHRIERKCLAMIEREEVLKGMRSVV